MIKSFYEKVVFKHPLKLLFVLIGIVAFLGFYATKLEIDASSDTLLLENDSDLMFTRDVAKKFKTDEFLVIAYTPKNELLSNKTIKHLKSLTQELEALERIKSTTSILNVPLLQSSNKPVKELVENIPTLTNTKLDLTLVKEEFLTSPLYKNNLVSKDFKTTAILINLQEIQESKAQARENNHIFIQEVRSIIASHKDQADMFLGGVNMVADDLITFVKSDLSIYGTTLLGLLILILWIIFREVRWVVIPVVICLISILCTTGLLGYFGWKVTVVSSNFISLQLIITISIVLHLIVRYRELVLKNPQMNQTQLVMETIESKLSPSFFAILTTIVGFASLIFSNILPVINLGWMMSSGIALSLLIAFLLFPIILLKLPISKPYTRFEKDFALTKIFANLVENHTKKIYIASALVTLFSITGAMQLIVENSFINYFKKTTEIYQGMKVIDESLGGTTPLDIVVSFKEEKEIEPLEVEEANDEFSNFDDEFEEAQNENQYWFTPNKMKKIEEIHDYLENRPEIGNVQSFATMLKVGRKLNDGDDLDNFALALLYNKLPPEFKKLILEPYINIEENTIRFSTRIIDSNEELRRDELIQTLNKELNEIIDNKSADFRLSNLMILYNNMLQSLFESQILTLGLVLGLLFGMFLLIFKSFKIALIAIVSNAIPMGIIFGFMGWLEIPLDLMTITIAAISLGIGVDDTIHYIHRFNEELKKDGDYIQAMHRSHNSIGYAMYYTSFAIMLGFSILVLSNFLPTIYFGLLTMLVMLMALMGALLLLPRLMITFKTKP